MKMTKENYQIIIDGMKNRIEDIKKHKDGLITAKENGRERYNCLETRLAFDCYHVLYDWDFKDKLYKENDLNDTHIGTGLKKAMRELGII